MDKIRRIIQIGAYDTTNDVWSNEGSNTYVFFEDESITPLVLEGEDAYQAFEALAQEQGIDLTDNEEALGAVIEGAAENGLLELCNRENVEELEAANAELAAARARAEELSQGKEPEPGVVVAPPVVPPVTPTGVEPDPAQEPVQEEDYSEELAGPVAAKKNTGKMVLAGVLAAAAGFGAGFTIAQMSQNSEKTQDVDNDLDQDINFDTATFEQLMASMDENDPRRVTAETAMELVENFHEATHKDGNFRLEEDAETYLDLSFEEALVLTTFANYDEPSELYAVLGDYDISAEQAQNLLESARSKMITYYMNAVEPSGLAEIFQNEEDRAFFQNFESEVIAFNASHTTEASDQVMRDVYYNYILDGATNATNVGPMAKLLSFDAVYGGLNLVESASVDHTQFLEFHGMGEEAETRYYVENILHLDYDQLSDEDKAQYRENIIESGTQLVSLLENGQVMNEENSTQAEMDANVSITELVDKMGLCNSVNEQIKSMVEGLDTIQATVVTTMNLDLANQLRANGYEELAAKVDASINTTLSQELLEEIHSAGAEAGELATSYETQVGAMNDQNRPSMAQIIGAANRYTALMENFFGESKDIATLVNNRRHGIDLNKVLGPDSNGYYGEDEDGIPIYDDSVFDGMDDEEIDDFIKENGEVIDETTEEKTEEVTEDELTEEEKEEVEEEKAKIEAEIAAGNASAAGQIAANANANGSFYSFSPSSVTNPANGEVYDLNGMSFANGVAYSQAFGGSVPGTSDSQIENAAEVAAENYLDGLSDADKEAIANGMGTSWESARASLKESFKSGYMSQMQTEISTAIGVGNEMKAATEAAMKEVEELNKQAEEEAKQDEEQPAPSEEQEDQNEQGQEEPTPGIEEGEEPVQEGEQPAPGEGEQETPGETTPAPEETPSEDEYDPNIGEQFQEGEILIEDAQGNPVEHGGEETTEPVQEAPVTESTVETAAPAEEQVAAEEVSLVVETPAVVDVGEFAQAAPEAEAQVQAPAQAPFSIDIEAAVQQAYQEALAQEAAAAEMEESSTKTR